MKILLVGEYSRLHNSLKEGLLKLGHEVKIIGSGDHFKNYPVDYDITAKTVTSFALLRFIDKVLLRLLGFNFEQAERALRFFFFLPELKGFDAVQLINSDALNTHPSWETVLYKKLFAQNKKNFLLICGEDTPIIDVLLQNELKYSILTPYLNNRNEEGIKKHFRYSLKYISPSYRQLFDFVKSNSSKIITSDLDYQIPMQMIKTQTAFIANPINTDKISPIENPISDKIVIFHGVNKLSSIKKGSSFFEKALETISKKYPEKAEIITVNSLPYDDYQKILNKSHIVLDQVYGFDQGYNALEAMAKGKVVFTGAEKEFLDHYGLQEDEVAINALPDVDYLVQKLSFLIENPQKIITIGKNARSFIEREHDYITIAKRYLDVWEA